MPLHKDGMSRRAILRGRLWLLLLAVGLASSVAGIAVDVAIGLGRELRHGVLAFGGHTLTRFVLWVAWSVGLTCLAVWLGRESTAAQGSGIPQMKVILAGGMPAARAESYLSPRCLAVKMAGLTLGKVAGLSIGKEGPWVHISAAIANIFSSAAPFAHLCGRKATTILLRRRTFC